MVKFQHCFKYKIIFFKFTNFKNQVFVTKNLKLGDIGGKVGQGKLSHFTFNCQAVNQNKRPNFTFKQKILKD